MDIFIRSGWYCASIYTSVVNEKHLAATRLRRHKEGWKEDDLGCFISCQPVAEFQVDERRC